MSEIPEVDIVVPVKNEEHNLAPSVTRLVAYLRDAFPFTARVTIADNGSTDRTWLVACSLAEEFAEIRAVHLDQPGRGRALHEVWSASDAELLAYMDVDLSTDLNALLPLVAPLLSGHSDVAIGTRLAHGAGHPRPEARDHLALLQPPAPDHPTDRVLRRAVRVQGDQGLPGAAVAAAGGGHGLVLRHRAARARRARRAAHPRGPRGLDRRHGLAGQHHRHGAPGGAGVPMGGLSGSTQVSSALIKLLEQDAAHYKWIAATVGSQSAAPIELATGGDAVIAIGGFNGTDPSPTLAEFEAMVAKGEIHYFVGESGNSFGGGNGSSAITSWVAAHFKSETVGGVTVYNLTQQK